MVARNDLERCITRGLDIFGLDSLDSCGRRCRCFELVDEPVKHPVRALHFDEDSVGVVTDEPGKTHVGGKAVDERPEANPLDDPGDAKTAAVG